MEALKAQMQVLLKKQAPPAAEQATAPPAPAPKAEVQQEVEELKEELETVKAQAEASQSGSTKFLLTGYGFADYMDRGKGKSSFNAGFNPIFLWKLSHRLLFEGELEIALGEEETDVGLEYAQIDYLLNDYMTLVAGKFLNPSNYFAERIHPPWINKLPDFPLPLAEDTALQGFSQVGFQVRGGLPLGRTRLGYALFVSNGPRLHTEGEDAGSLDFENSIDIDNNKAVGGRIGFWPLWGLELGYSFEVADTSGNDFRNVETLIHAVDLNFARPLRALKGSIDLRAQYIWQEIDNPGLALLDFHNNSNGGYAQIAYQPYEIGWPVLQNLEAVFRYDRLDLPRGAPLNIDEQRWTLGLNYWLAASTVFKFAFEFDDKDGASDDNAVLFQVATGF